MNLTLRPLTCASLALLALPKLAGAVDWLPSSGDWDVPANWSTTALPLITENVVVGANRTATITSTGSINAQDLWVGVTSGTGTVIQNGNTLNINTGGRLSVGNDAVNGTYQMNAGTINGAGS
jgi:hypothetical protein